MNSNHTTNRTARRREDTPVFIVEDDKALNAMIRKDLEERGWAQVTSLYTGEALLENLDKDRRSIVIQDIDLPGIDGMEVLRRARKEFPHAEFIFLSGQHRVEIAVEAIRLGAFDYIEKNSHTTDNIELKLRNLEQVNRLERLRKNFKMRLVLLLILFILTWLVVLIIRLFTGS